MDAANGREKCGNKTGEFNPEVGPPPRGLEMTYSAVKDVTQAPVSHGIDFSNITPKEKCQWAKSCDIFWEGVSDKDCGDKKAFDDWNL